MSHPLIEAYADLLTLPQPACALGYRMPAEWEPHASVWVSWPHNAETWPQCLPEAQRQFHDWIERMRRYLPVCTTQALGIDTNDSWIRDFGPIFVVRDDEAAAEAGEDSPLAIHDFHFNGWGGKYELRDLDDRVPQRIAHALQLPIWVHNFVLEGGAIDVNGRGTALSTEQCMLNPNRNPHLDRETIEARLSETLGIERVIWLVGGITGDDTDGHIDGSARFVDEQTVLAASAPRGHPDHETLAENLRRLRSARTAEGRPLTVVELPMPQPLFYDYPADRFDEGGRRQLPASYANFLVTNGGVFVPAFGQRSDEAALRLLEQAFPGRDIVPVRCEHLLVGQGTLHCLSQQQPATGAGTPGCGA